MNPPPHTHTVPSSPFLLKSSTIFHISFLCCCIRLKHPAGCNTSLHIVGGSASLTCKAPQAPASPSSRSCTQWESLGRSDLWEPLGDKLSLVNTEAGLLGLLVKVVNREQRWWNGVTPSSSWKKALEIALCFTRLRICKKYIRAKCVPCGHPYSCQLVWHPRGCECLLCVWGPALKTAVKLKAAVCHVPVVDA